MRDRRWIILGLCVSLWPYIATAQITMEAQLGLQGTVRLEKWNLVTVHLENAGASFVGTLGVRIQRGSDFRKDLHITTFTQTVELPHRSRKRLHFVVPITSISHPVEVFLRQHEQILVQRHLNLRDAFNAEHVILGVTGDLSLDFLATAFQRHTRVAYLSPRTLPQRWSGYDTVSAVVVKGVSLQTMTETQVTALRQWIARGGTLVVAGDSQYGLLQEPYMRALLPVEVLGIQQLEGLPAFAEAYREALPSAPLLAIQSRLTHGRILVGTAAAPLLVERSFGKGRVVFLAVDYAAQPLLAWAGGKALWKDMLQPAEEIDFGRVFAELGLLDDAHPIVKLLRRPLLAYPSHMALSVFLIVYGGGLGLLFWRMGKPHARLGRYWLTVVLVVLAGTAVAYGVFAEPSLRRSALVIDVAAMEILPDTDYTHTQSYVGLFSPRGGSYELTFQAPETILRHTFHRGSGQAGRDIEIVAGDPFIMRGITLDPWMLRVFSTESMMPAPLQIKAWRHATGLTMQVKNRGAMPLQGPIVVYRGKLFLLDALAPGAEIFEDLYTTSHAGEGPQEMLWQALFKRRPVTADSRLTYLQEVMLQQYFGQKRLTETDEVPLLAAWVMAPMTLRTVPSAFPIRGMTLVVSRLSS